MMECMMRGIPIGPIDTYKGWQAKGRQVRKGEKAIEPCQPVTVKRKSKDGDEDEQVRIFIWRKRWFVLAQTDGPELEFGAVPNWSKERALEALSIVQVPFEHPDHK